MEDGNLLEIHGLKVEVDSKEILHGIDLTIRPGETHVIYGPNGSGKTTLLMTLMGFPKYKITAGSIIFEGKDVTNYSLDERARAGIGLSFQRPPIVRGVKTKDMVMACFANRENGETLAKLAEKANMASFLERDINHGFSGGETKRSELLQLLAQSPDLVLLDEPESGVDLENIALIGELINDLLEKTHPMRNRTRSGLIISHTGHILNYVNARTGYVMFEGHIICEGDPHEILETVKVKGYGDCASCQICKR